uniref:type II toxin-antitoxin system RelE/ParE family toxin n=1 Tax=Komagataeibacter xylinus TaxID=28448 RepID=UPI002412B87B|nr:type II toxin-antitoxin system RelE/ParE family toxin [Komagataeibacter xylinus]
MTWLVEHTNEFEAWFDGLSESEQVDVYASGLLLEERGPNLRHPMSSGINGSRHNHMRELRVQSGGKPIRVFICVRSPPGRHTADRWRQDRG